MQYCDVLLWWLNSCTSVFEVVRCWTDACQWCHTLCLISKLSSCSFLHSFQAEFFKNSFIHKFYVRFCVAELADCPFLNAHRNFLIVSFFKWRQMRCCGSEVLQFLADCTAVQYDWLLAWCLSSVCLSGEVHYD